MTAKSMTVDRPLPQRAYYSMDDLGMQALFSLIFVVFSEGAEKLRPVLPSLHEGLLMPPFLDVGRVAGKQHLRHGHAPKVGGPGVLGVYMSFWFLMRVSNMSLRP